MKKVRQNSPDDIYFLRSDLPPIETSDLFEILEEDGKLRVRNKNVNCLFSNLSKKTFDSIYNDYLQCLNLNFSPLMTGNTVCQLTGEEQKKLTENIITYWMYFYTINSMSVRVKRSDFTHPYMVDFVLQILDKKYGIDTEESIQFGAHLLRQNIEDYRKTVKARRWYYER
jgi:hypothetical protein